MFTTSFQLRKLTLLWYFALETMLSLSFIQDKDTLRMLTKPCVSHYDGYVTDLLVLS